MNGPGWNEVYAAALAVDARTAEAVRELYMGAGTMQAAVECENESLYRIALGSRLGRAAENLALALARVAELRESLRDFERSKQRT